jgi:hypothetical protein
MQSGFRFLVFLGLMALGAPGRADECYTAPGDCSKEGAASATVKCYYSGGTIKSLTIYWCNGDVSETTWTIGGKSTTRHTPKGGVIPAQKPTVD